MGPIWCRVPFENQVRPAPLNLLLWLLVSGSRLYTGPVRIYSFSLVAPISFFRVVSRYLPTYFPPPPSSTYLCSSLSLSNNQSCSFLANIRISVIDDARSKKKKETGRTREKDGENRHRPVCSLSMVRLPRYVYYYTCLSVRAVPASWIPVLRAPSSTRALTRAYSTVVVGADGRVGEKSKPTGFANHPPGRDRARGRRIRGVRLVDRHSRGSLPGDKWITPNLLAHSRAGSGFPVAGVHEALSVSCETRGETDTQILRFYLRRKHNSLPVYLHFTPKSADCRFISFFTLVKCARLDYSLQDESL